MTVACPVVAKHHRRRELVLYGGAEDFSKDQCRDGDGRRVHGWMSLFREYGWDVPTGCCRLVGLSQDHGIVAACERHFARVSVGDAVAVVPAHGCLRANLMESYLTLDGRRIHRFR